MKKLEAHQKALLHRCFSILIFNSKNELLIQQRALDKYHCPGIRANACCSHQRQGESTLDAAHRRLQEELGFDCPLEEKFHFVYKAEFDNGLTEHEFDHVLVGNYDGEVLPNPEEVVNYKRVSLEELDQELQNSPEKYAVWFKIILEKWRGIN